MNAAANAIHVQFDAVPGLDAATGPAPVLARYRVVAMPRTGEGDAALCLDISGARGLMSLQSLDDDSVTFVTLHSLVDTLCRQHGIEAGSLNLIVEAASLGTDTTATLGALSARPGQRLTLATRSTTPERTARSLERALPHWDLDTTDAGAGGVLTLGFVANGQPPLDPDEAPEAEPAPAARAVHLPVTSALNRVAVAEGAGVLAGLQIASAVFDEHQVTGTVTGQTAPDTPLPTVMAMTAGEVVAMAPLRHRPDGTLAFALELPRGFLFDGADDAVDLHLGVPTIDSEATRVALPKRRLVSAEKLLAFERPGEAPSRRKPFGIVLYSFTRTEGAMLVLESLKRQGALEFVEVWMDGDQGKPAVKTALEQAEQQFRDFGVAKVTRHRGNLGFRKLILQSLMYMADTYDRFLVLEDDCFPNRNALTEFLRSLDKHADDPDVLTTYGHHFMIPAEQPVCPRFQGWGWATWSDKFRPFLEELAYLYSLPEPVFTDWATRQLTKPILERLDCTAPRGASITVQRFFAWDETLALISALAGKGHAPTAQRCVYNFGVGEDSTHFTNIDWYRKPPFNMVLKSEVWDHF